jgi:ribosomal protein S17
MRKEEANTMAEQRGIRKTRVGVVVSDKMDKTVVVEIAPASSIRFMARS